MTSIAPESPGLFGLAFACSCCMPGIHKIGLVGHP